MQARAGRVNDVSPESLRDRPSCGTRWAAPIGSAVSGGGRARAAPGLGARGTLGARRQALGSAISRIAEDIGAISNRLGELAHRHGLSFDAREYQVFNQCIDTASAAAIQQYSEREREQRERGELEGLGTVAHELRNTLAGARMLQLSGDENLILSAIGNLVQNALKLTRDGGHITVRGHAAGPSVVVEVEDECGGLPPGKPEELFAPFVSKSASRRGLGLGLTITRHAAEAHGGGVSVANLPGKGCIFRLTLPSNAREREPG